MTDRLLRLYVARVRLAYGSDCARTDLIVVQKESSKGSYRMVLNLSSDNSSCMLKQNED